MSQRLERERDIALEAVREAARLCVAVRKGDDLESLAKHDLSPVTVADFGSQALIGRLLAEAFPDDPLIAEEDAAELRKPENAPLRDQVVAQVRQIRPAADVDAVERWIDHGGARAYSERFWTLDPIDGTKGYLRGEQYAIALALIVEGRVAVAALACPNLPRLVGEPGQGGAVFVAERGQGAWTLPLTGDAAVEPVAVRVSPRDDPSAVRFCESVESGHSAHGDSARVAERLGINADPVRLDSQAKYAVVARGEADIYLRLPTRPGYREKIWDHAAGALIVEEAGGTVTDIHGAPLDFTRGQALEQNRGVIVTNGRLHARVLNALDELGLTSSSS